MDHTRGAGGERFGGFGSQRDDKKAMRQAMTNPGLLVSGQLEKEIHDSQSPLD